MAFTEAIRDGYGVEASEISEIVGGKDPFAKTYGVATVAGERLFVKLRTGIDPGVSLSSALRDSGIEAVLAPIKTLSGQLAHILEDKAVLVYPYVEGHNGFQQPLKSEHWRSIGESLRRIHDAELPRELLDGLSRERFVVDDIAGFEATRDRLLSGTWQTLAEEALASVLATHEPAIGSVLREVVDRGASCRQREWDLAPCHADLHVGNILAEPNGYVNLIDWDAPRLAPRECDLLFFCDGGILDAHGEAEEASFFEGYGPWVPDRLALTYYQYARIAEDIVAYAKEATDPSYTLEERMEAVRGFKVALRSSKIGR